MNGRAVDERLSSSLPPVDLPWQKTTLRRAAVLAPIVARAGVDHVLFLVRSANLRQHAGQVSFPGGADDGDETPWSCALRETEEEIGVARELVVPLGSLTTATSSSNFRVHCLVARLPDDAVLRLDAGEVARAMFVPLAELLDPSRWYEKAPPQQPDGRTFPPSPHFDHDGAVIWGLTGRFCSLLLAALRA